MKTSYNWSGLLVIALALHFNPCVWSQRSPSSGWNNQYYKAARSMIIQNSNQVPESFNYQASTGRVIISNTLNGEFYGIPYSNMPTAVTYTAADMIPQSSTSNISFGTFGLVMDPVNDTFVWAALSLRPPTTTSICAFEKVNTKTRETVAFYNYSTFRNPTLGYCFMNDFAIDGGNAVYATDFWGYQIFKLDLKTGTQSVLNNNQTILCGTSTCTGTSSNGPNGIVLYTDSTGKNWLLIAVVPKRFIKMDTVTGYATVINPGVNTPMNSIYQLDGMALYNQGSRNSVLYAVGKVPNTGGTVQVLTSTNEWSTFDLRQVYNANCSDPSDTAVRLAESSVMILCNNAFAVGTDYITIIPNAAGNPIASTIQTIVYPMMIPESFNYDANRNMLIFGSFTGGAIRGFPYNSFTDSTVTYDNTSVHEYIAAGTDGIYSTAGIGIFDASSCLAYVCMGKYPPNVTLANSIETGLYTINTCTNTVHSYVTLPISLDGNGSMANDVTLLNGILYVSDFVGNQVWTVVTDSYGTLSKPTVVLTSRSCAANDPSFCVLYPDGMEAVNSPSSVGTVPYVLISMLLTGILKYEPSTGVLWKVGDPTRVIFGFDGMKFNKDKSILYGTRNGFDASSPFQSVFAVTSSNDWSNASLVYAFQLNCTSGSGAPGGSNAPAITLVTNQYGLQDLVILCNDGFGPGPYSVQRIVNVDSTVHNQPLYSAESVSTGSTSTSSSSTSGAGSSTETTVVVGVVLGVFVLVLAAVVAMYAFNPFNVCAKKKTHDRESLIQIN